MSVWEILGWVLVACGSLLFLLIGGVVVAGLITIFRNRD